MAVNLQKANMWKRIAAWILDIILTAVLAVGFGMILSAVLDYDGYNAKLQACYERYETQYGVVFDISQEEYDTKTEEEKTLYDEAYLALISDDQVLHAYNMTVSLSLIITTFAILLGVLAMEFVVPLCLKNGQTVGKKAFGLGTVRYDGVRINTLQLFVRALLGKYTIETMIPVYIILMFHWNTMGMTGTVVLLGLAAAQLLCLGITKDNSAIHDKLAGTVVVDLASQKVFGSTEELVEYTKRIHAECAKHEDY